MADKPKIKKILRSYPAEDYEGRPIGYDVTEGYDDKGNWGQTTSEDRTDNPPRERRQRDRRKVDQKTINIRRKLTDRRNNYPVTYVKPDMEALGEDVFTKEGVKKMPKSYRRTIARESGMIGHDLIKLKTLGIVERVQKMRADREIARRGGNLKAMVKGKKGLLGLGAAIGTAIAAAQKELEK